MNSPVIFPDDQDYGLPGGLDPERARRLWHADLSRFWTNVTTSTGGETRPSFVPTTALATAPVPHASVEH